MAAFEYLALDPSGRQQKGVLEADSARQVRQLLRERQLALLDEAHPYPRAERAGRAPDVRPRLSARDLALVTRQLATLVQAALPIEEALRAAAAQSTSQRIQSMLLAVRAKVLVLRAIGLAGSLREFPASPFPSCTGRRLLPASMPGTSAWCWSNLPIKASSKRQGRGRRSSWRCSIR